VCTGKQSENSEDHLDVESFKSKFQGFMADVKANVTTKTQFLDDGKRKSLQLVS